MSKECNFFIIILGNSLFRIITPLIFHHLSYLIQPSSTHLSPLKVFLVPSGPQKGYIFYILRLKTILDVVPLLSKCVQFVCVSPNFYFNILFIDLVCVRLEIISWLTIEVGWHCFIMSYEKLTSGVVLKLLAAIHIQGVW